MGLTSRLERLESKIRPANTEHHIDLDQCLAGLGLVPTAVRDLARCKNSSLAEAISEMLGIECRKFQRQLHEAVRDSIHQEVQQ